MPTNNQEKWSERFDKEFPYAWIEFKDDGTHIEKMRLVKSFILQEIRQAKIETVKELVSILESSFDESFLDKERINTKIYSASLKALSNLKQNDNTTKNRVLYF